VLARKLRQIKDSCTQVTSAYDGAEARRALTNHTMLNAINRMDKIEEECRAEIMYAVESSELEASILNGLGGY
jgi:hypothetical protein